MGEVRKNTGLTGWQELGKTLSDSVKGILTSINKALSGVNWEKVGKSIGQFLGSIDWVGIWSSVGKTIGNAFNSIMTIANFCIERRSSRCDWRIKYRFWCDFCGKNNKRIVW